MREYLPFSEQQFLFFYSVE